MDKRERLQGKLFEHALEVGHVPRRAFPACFRQMPEVTQAFLPFTDLVQKDPNTVIQIINAPRTCSQWMQYTPGFSPKEHLEDRRMQELELRRQEFDLKLDERNRRFQIKVTIMLVVFAFFQAAAAFLQVAFPTGWPWLMQYAQPTVIPIPGGF